MLLHLLIGYFRLQGAFRLWADDCASLCCFFSSRQWTMRKRPLSMRRSRRLLRPPRPHRHQVHKRPWMRTHRSTEQPTIGSAPCSISRATTAPRRSTLASRFRSQLIRAHTYIYSALDLLTEVAAAHTLRGRPHRGRQLQIHSVLSGPHNAVSSTTFAAGFGGGADYAISRGVAVRLIEVDYVPTRFREITVNTTTGQVGFNGSIERKTMFVHRWASFSGLGSR